MLELRIQRTKIYSSGNVAYGKRTNQSGSYQGQTSNRAVDGNIVINSGDAMKTCAHPYTWDVDGGNAWWYVDLGSVHQVYNVTVFNTDDEWGKD